MTENQDSVQDEETDGPSVPSYPVASSHTHLKPKKKASKTDKIRRGNLAASQRRTSGRFTPKAR